MKTKQTVEMRDNDFIFEKKWKAVAVMVLVFDVVPHEEQGGSRKDG